MSKRLTRKQAPAEKSPTPTTRRRLSTKQSVKASSPATAARREASPPPIAAAASKYDDIIRKIFYDVRDGFGSVEETWKAAKKQNPQITKAIVRDFIKRQAIRQKKKEPKWNSWVAREALQTIQIDLAEMPKRIFGESEFKYALFAYDVFSKKLAVVPLKTKSSEVTAKVLEQIFEEDIGLPLQVYTDEGGEFVKNFSKNKILCCRTKNI